MSYLIEESIGNFSRTIETVDTLEEAEQHIYDYANNDMFASDDNDLDLEYHLSCYAIIEEEEEES